MANCIFAYPDKTLQAALSGGSWSTTLPLNNLTDSTDNRMATKARSVNAKESSTQFLIDMGSLQDVKVIALIGHNASKTATFDVTLTTTPTPTVNKLSNPATLPTGTGAVSSWSPDGSFLVVGHDVAPFITIYQVSGTTFTKVANPATLPTGTAWGAYWSPDGTTLAIVHDLSPFITLYQRSGTTFTKIANPAVLPVGTVNAAAWSPDGNFLITAHETAPYVTIYQWTGTALEVMGNSILLPTGTAMSINWSPNYDFLVVGHDVAPFFKAAAIVNSTYTPYTPAILPTGIVYDVSWSPNGEFLAVAHDVAPFITVYQVVGSTLVKIANPAILPTGTAWRVNWSPNGEFLAVAHDVTPFITIYQRSGTTLTKIADPTTLPAGTAWRVNWSPDNQFLAVAHDLSPFLTVYQVLGTTFTKLPDPATLPAGTGAGVDWSPDGTLLTFAHDLSPFVTIYQPYAAYMASGIPFYTAFYPKDALPTGHPDKATGGVIADEDMDIYPRQVYLVLTPAYSVQGRYLRIAIHDATNAAGFFELSRCFVAPGWQPEVNMLYGVTLGWESSTIIDTIPGGSAFYDRKFPRRACNLSLILTPEQMLSNVLWMQKKLDVSGELFFVFDPDEDTMVEKMQSFLCTMKELSALEYTEFRHNTIAKKLIEVI